jgi:hypothetical protein
MFLVESFQSDGVLNLKLVERKKCENRPPQPSVLGHGVVGARLTDEQLNDEARIGE